MNNFKDKVIWITGASSGIGEALAYGFAKLGARLILSARNENKLKEVATKTQLPELDLMILPFDLNDTSNASGLAAEVINKFGRIDILINNGGISQRSEALVTSEKIERQLMEVNYFASVNLAKAVTHYMKRQKTSQIVIISSIAGKFGFHLRSSYSAAKHALQGYFESFRLETENFGIKTLIVYPGKINTNISYNAVLNDGELHNQLDPSHVNAMTAEACASKIIQAIKEERQEILIGGKEIKVVLIKRFFPSLFYKIIRRQKPL